MVFFFLYEVEDCGDRTERIRWEWGGTYGEEGDVGRDSLNWKAFKRKKN